MSSAVSVIIPTRDRGGHLELSSSQQVLMERRAARKPALEPLRLAPLSAWRDRDIRRPFVRPFLPVRLLQVCRPVERK
jgi:hypothetical protein